MLEMFRRIVWNFYRMDNEMFSNAERYRIVDIAPMPVKITSNKRQNADVGAEETDDEPAGDTDWMIGQKELQRFKSAVKLNTNSLFTTLYRLNRFFVHRIPEEEQIAILKGVLPEDTVYLTSPPEDADDPAAVSAVSPYEVSQQSNMAMPRTSRVGSVLRSAANVMSYMLTKFFRVRSVSAKGLRGTPTELYSSLGEEEKTRAFMLRVGPKRKISDYVDWISLHYGSRVGKGAASAFAMSATGSFMPPGPHDPKQSTATNPASSNNRASILVPFIGSDERGGALS